jgi:hypothetical protein
VAGILTYRLVAYVLVGVVGWAIWAAVRHRLPIVPEQPIRDTLQNNTAADIHHAQRNRSAPGQTG